MIGVNESLVLIELVFFGGVKEFGLGCEGLVFGLDEFMEVKILYLGNL